MRTLIILVLLNLFYHFKVNAEITKVDSLPKTKYIAIKFGLFNPILGNYTFEFERLMKDKTAYTFKAGVGLPTKIKTLNYYIKTGVKFYKKTNKTKQYVHPSIETEVMFTKLKNTSLRVNYDIYSYGFSVNLHIEYLICKRIIVDPYIGLGLNYYQGVHCFIDDSAPNGFPIGLVCRNPNKVQGEYLNSHQAIHNNFSGTLGLKIGYQFYK